MHDIVVLLCGAFIAFMIGSIPNGVIVSKIFFNKDVRDEGSGNIGFTNSLRTLGKLGGGAVFILDFAKGLLCGYLGIYILPLLIDSSQLPYCAYVSDFTGALCGMCATLGHIFSPWLHFRGGKGISTAFGASFFTISIWGACILFGAFLIFVICTRYVSLGSCVAAILYPIVAIFYKPASPGAIFMFLVVGIVVLWAHRSNIGRIIHGNERKIGAKKKD